MALEVPSQCRLLLLLLLAMAATRMGDAGDPDIVSDFVLPPNATAVDANYFTYTNLSPAIRWEEGPPANFTVLKASMAEFPALEGQSVSTAALLYPPGAVNPPHTHPRSAELLFLVYGSLEVGFVDTENRLYKQTLQPGDVFVFPKGLLHYQYALGQGPAVAVSAFGSASAGTVSVPRSVFGDGIDDVALANAFKTDVGTIRKVIAGLAQKA